MSLFAKKSFVGVDLGHHTLKVAQIDRTPSGWRVSKYATARTPIDTVRDGIVVDPPVLGIALKNLLKEAHIGATSASIAVSGGTVVVRPVRMPKMAASALRKSIRFEASRYVPSSVEESYIEFEIVNDSDDVNMDVLISAAPKELIDSRMRACEAAGLDVENVEVGAFAAFRSVVEADPDQDWSDKTVALLDIGASTSNMSIVSHGAFSMTRAIPNGGQVLTDTLKNYFKLSTEDAERGKAQLDVTGLIGDAKVIENPPLRVLHSHLDDMVREVRRSINYWQSQQTEGVGPKQIDQIIMSGGGAQMPGLSEYFEHKLGIPTKACGVFDNAHIVGSHSEEDRGFQLALASGLAMSTAPAKAAAAKAPKQPSDEKPPKAAKPPRAPKPGKTQKGNIEEAAPIDVAPPAIELATEELEFQVPAAFQSIEPTVAAMPESSDMIPAEFDAPVVPPIILDLPIEQPVEPTVVHTFAPEIEVIAPTFENPISGPEIVAPTFEAPTLAVEHVAEEPSHDVPHLEVVAPTFEMSTDEPPVPAELQAALDAVLDLEEAARQATRPTYSTMTEADLHPTPPHELMPTPAVSLELTGNERLAKKPMFSMFSGGAKAPKAEKDAKPAKAEKAPKPVKVKDGGHTGLKTAKPVKPAKEPFSFSFKRKPKLSQADTATVEPTVEVTDLSKPAPAKQKLGGSLFKKRKPDDSSEAPKKEAA